MNKGEQLSRLSEELLNELESSSTTLEQAILKTIRLARLSGDSEAHKWLRLELNGYDKDHLPADITYAEACVIGRKSDRPYTWRDPKSNEIKNYIITESVPELEAGIETNMLAIQNITMPTHVTPNQNVWQNESYSTVLNNVTTKQNNLKEAIKRNRNHLAKIRASVYNYVFEIYSKYHFEVVLDSIFTQVKEEVDAKLQALVPDALSQFSSAFNRLRDGDGEDLSQAVATCRNVLDSLADAIYPPQKGKDIELSDGSKVKIGKDSYKNRIIAVLDKNSSKSSDALLTKARAEELTKRLHHVHNILSKGAKNKITKGDAQRYVIETYLLIGEIMAYIDSKPTKEA